LGPVPAGGRGRQPLRCGAADEQLRDVHRRGSGRPDCGREEGPPVRRRSRLLVLALMAAAAPLAFLASTVPAGKAQLATAEHPVIDNDFLYKHLYDSSPRF